VIWGGAGGKGERKILATRSSHYCREFEERVTNGNCELVNEIFVEKDKV